MKKILLFLLLTLAGKYLLAQITVRPQVGFNFSSISGDFENLTFNDRSGWQVGVDVMIGNRFYLQPGLHYELVKNELETGNGGNPILTTDLDVSRVRIPVMLGYRLLSPQGGLLNLRVFTGPNMSIVTNVDDDESSFDIDNEDFKSAVFGWNVGAGLDLLFLFADVGYQFGLSEVFEDLNINGIQGASSTNNLFYLNAGIRIRF